MRISSLFFQTKKEVPKEAQIISHQLMFRAGMIQQLASGVYNYLPLALKSLRKLENIIREELDKRGCQEVLMPVVQPAELWKESGRWDYYGPELLRFQDRKGADFCLGPTHEEVVTDMVRKNLKSYRQLPWNLYQVQGKFRDEVRPRFGLMRGREFIMKDGYSFDVDEKAAKQSYDLMYEAYNAIFSRCGLSFRAVDAATGAIGGDMSHEFQVLAESGEDLVLACDSCDYAANEEKARTQTKELRCDATLYNEMEEVSTPDQKAVEDVAAFLKTPVEQFIKSMIFVAGGEPVMVLVRGDREVNESKIQAYLSVDEIALADDKTVEEITGAPTGFAGPVNLKKEIRILADWSITGIANMVCGANKNDAHLVNVNSGKDFELKELGDFIVIEAGEICPQCDGKLQEHRGIEVGQVFYLGTKYSERMNCTFIGDDGKSYPAVMGCYGIGVGRTLQAAIEQNHDDYGIIWPMALAPFEVVVMPLQMNKEVVVETGEKFYKELREAGLEVALDDRNERAGFKFNDSDLVGYPVQVILGARSIENGVAEVKIRKTGEKIEIKLDEVVEWVKNYRDTQING
ncbi:proline--tRNA ligase [bacterium]|nr:proline--tRNA ligase [bacterium]